MSTKKERKICNSCGKKTVLTKLIIFEGKFYHTNCLGTEFEKCPITGKFLDKNKSDFYNEIRLLAPLTFQLWVQHIKADL